MDPQLCAAVLLGGISRELQGFKSTRNRGGWEADQPAGKG